MRLYPCVAAILVAGAGGAIAQTPPVAQTAPSTSAMAEPAKTKPICRREEVVGSNLPHRNCHTAEQWKQIDNPGTEQRRQMANEIKPKL